LQQIIDDGPPSSAKCLARAIVALLPHAIALAVVPKLAEHCMDIMRAQREEGAAVNAVLVLSDIVQCAPGEVAGDMKRIMEWAMDTVMPSGAAEDAAQRGCAVLAMRPEVLSAPAPVHV
jgi:hypothetical protein